ncbi:MAG TPA: hypothetical protein VNV82_20520 [Bryobacteraceae bacterium]|nr:hypothetical protein [Bryobacteraceae bacterium]
MSKLNIAGLLCGTLLSAQSGKQVAPAGVLHQYSGISPLSANKDKLHTFDLHGNARILRLQDASLIADNAPYPEAHWDNADDDLMWVIGGQTSSKPVIQTWRPSTRRYSTYINYAGRFTSITTGSTSDLTYDDWEAFWAPAEHQVCAVDLKAKKTYCIDYNAPDPVNKMGETKDVDYVAVTPRDSKSGLHYLVMFANPAMAVFSVDESAGKLRWIVRPETVVPWMGSGRGNNDGNCDPGESCLTTPHGDIFAAPDGQVYFEMQVGIEIHSGAQNACEAGQGLLRLNAGLKMTTPENAFGKTGGGMKYIGPDFACGGSQVWSSQHTGCARWGQHCVISFDTPPPQPGQTTPRNEELWLIGLTPAGAVSYSRLGNSNSSAFQQTNDSYWSTSRAAMSMDGALVLYGSDHGTRGASQAIYLLPSGLPSVQRH